MRRAYLDNASTVKSIRTLKKKKSICEYVRLTLATTGDLPYSLCMSNAITTIALATLAIVEHFATDHNGPEIEPFWAGCRWGAGYCDCDACSREDAEIEEMYRYDNERAEYERMLNRQLDALEAEHNAEWQAKGQTIAEFLAGRLAA